MRFETWSKRWIRQAVPLRFRPVSAGSFLRVATGVRAVVQSGVTFEESVKYLSGLLQFGIRLDRERFVALLERLGSPHEKLRCIHVAGTNGKGSTCTFASSVLSAAGYRVGTYLSPYVFDLRERIQLNGALIPREDFARWVTAIRPHIEAIAQTDLGPTTEFELKTAVAFCWFVEQAVDYAVIEVGIGGRLDATNVIPPPLVAVITSISWDHMHILGDTLAKIAREKAGILKPGTLCVTAVTPGEALDAIERVAGEKHVPLLRVAAEGVAEEHGAFVTYRRKPQGGLTLHLPSGDIAGLRLALRGAYQARNAATAAAAIEVLRRQRDVLISEEALRVGLEQATIPGRFQLARQGGTESPTLLLDGAHNEDGARTLAEALRAEFGRECRYTFVVGTSRNHDPFPFLEVLAPLAARVVATAPPFRPTPSADVEQAASRLGLPVTVVEPATDAIRRTWEGARPGEVIVVTGSLFLVGETPGSLRSRKSGGGL
jgi:dihydrofolate synthase/folylpolyglutamate synthase